MTDKDKRPKDNVIPFPQRPLVFHNITCPAAFRQGPCNCKPDKAGK